MLNSLFLSYLSSNQILTPEDDISPFMNEWRGRFKGKCLCVLLPKTAHEISKIIKTAKDNKLKIIIQGGNTGLVGGQIPQDEKEHILISMKNMNQIRDYSPEDFGITVEAGIILENLHNHIKKDNLIFPMRLASEGSAQIGGLISTNAGGTSVLQYGMMQDLVFGVEAVMADGSIINETHYLRKANRGISLKSLLCGTEGQYGIITAASLKLFPKPPYETTLMIGFNNLDQIINIMSILREKLGNIISLYELIPSIGIDFLKKHKGISNPFKSKYKWYSLIQISYFQNTDNLNEQINITLEDFYDKNIILDAIIAQNQSKANELHKIRILLSEVQKFEGVSIKHDISVPIRNIPTLISQGTKSVKNILPEIRPFPFGHVGDGNIHFNFSQPIGMDCVEFMSYEKQINDTIFDIVHKLDGSFSAEHGIGILRKKQLEHYSTKEQNYFRKNLKKSLDPENILGI